MPETIYIGYTSTTDLPDCIAGLVKSVLQRERILKHEESPLDRLAHNVRVLQRRASGIGHAPMEPGQPKTGRLSHLQAGARRGL